MFEKIVFVCVIIENYSTKNVFLYQKEDVYTLLNENFISVRKYKNYMNTDFVRQLQNLHDLFRSIHQD